MDQKRLILAIGLSFIVMVGWAMLFGPKETQETIDKDATKTVEETKELVQETKEVKEKITVPVVTKKETEKNIPKTVVPTKEIQIETPLYIARITNQGAKLINFSLKNFKETSDKESANKEMVFQENGTGTILTKLNTNGSIELNNENFSVNVKENNIQINEEEKNIAFKWHSNDGLVVEKKYIFKPKTYLIDLIVTLRNNTDRALKKEMHLTLVKGPPTDSGTYAFEGPSTLIQGSLEQIDIDDVKKKDTYKGTIKWIAVQDRYFLSSIVPENEIETSLKLSLDKKKILNASYIQPVSIDSGISENYNYQLYIGPKSMKMLRGYNNGLHKAIYFGWFDFLAKPCLWLMNFLHDNFIPNYGIAIIILTLITKGILWPLGTKSYKSMGEMKKLQPLIKEIREKHKDNKKKMNEETMALYRTYKINPLGGCLPMVVQIPVFFALYRMLYEAIELRHAPFFGWITDLSAPDRLFNFDIHIPYMAPPYGIPVLTIVMGASMLLQQKMSPPMGDPAQAKMMMLMPIIFTVIFINFSSGLVLYWLINNLVSMGQQYYITKKTA